jgi:hypothetical protein
MDVCKNNEKKYKNTDIRFKLGESDWALNNFKTCKDYKI